MKYLNISNYIKPLCVTIMGFLLPIIPMILLTGLAIFMDTAIAVYYAKKNKTFLTDRLGDFVPKIILYQTAILLFYMIDKFLLMDVIGMFTTIEFVLTKLIALSLCWIEIESIDETWKEHRGVSIIKSTKNMIKRVKTIKEDITPKVE
jgi:hypothetical protein